VEPRTTHQGSGQLFCSTPHEPTPSSRHHSQMRIRMPHSKTFPLRRALAVLLISLPGCSSDLLLPDSPAEGQVVSHVTIVGDGQNGTVGGILAPLIVKVLTEADEPVEGVQVRFELTDPAAGSVSPAFATTNGSGEAVATWTLGTVPGSYIALAQIVTAEVTDSIEFHATAHPGAPDTLTALPPQNQPGAREQAVTNPPRVRVVDRFGNPVPDIPVAWQVIAGGGRVSGTISSTDSEGIATVEWILGNRIGVHKLTASVEQSSTGSPAVFEARVLF
jgi:Big-like domain-containing protein